MSGALFQMAVADIAAVLQKGGAHGELSCLWSYGFEGSVSGTAERAFARINKTYADVELDGDPISTTAYCCGRAVGNIFALAGTYQLAPECRVGGTAEIALKDDDAA